jgi:hypothetical protein
LNGEPGAISAEKEIETSNTESSTSLSAVVSTVDYPMDVVHDSYPVARQMTTGAAVATSGFNEVTNFEHYRAFWFLVATPYSDPGSVGDAMCQVIKGPLSFIMRQATVSS